MSKKREGFRRPPRSPRAAKSHAAHLDPGHPEATQASLGELGRHVAMKFGLDIPDPIETKDDYVNFSLCMLSAFVSQGPPPLGEAGKAQLAKGLQRFGQYLPQMQTRPCVVCLGARAAAYEVEVPQVGFWCPVCQRCNTLFGILETPLIHKDVGGVMHDLIDQIPVPRPAPIWALTLSLRLAYDILYTMVGANWSTARPLR